MQAEASERAAYFKEVLRTRDGSREAGEVGGMFRTGGSRALGSSGE